MMSGNFIAFMDRNLYLYDYTRQRNSLEIFLNVEHVSWLELRIRVSNLIGQICIYNHVKAIIN